MSWVIVRVATRAQSPPMTWEEETHVNHLRQLFRSRGIENAQHDNEAQRRRSNRIRNFLTAFGSTHWAERVEDRRIAL
jgi:hypothetical protein